MQNAVSLDDVLDQFPGIHWIKLGDRILVYLRDRDNGEYVNNRRIFCAFSAMLLIFSYNQKGSDSFNLAHGLRLIVLLLF